MKTVAFSIYLLAMPIGIIAENMQSAVVLERQEKEYKKVEDIQVPSDILKAASAKYSGYVLTESFMSEDGEYKLILSKDNKPVVVYFKATGEFIKEEAMK